MLADAARWMILGKASLASSCLRRSKLASSSMTVGSSSRQFNLSAVRLSPIPRYKHKNAPERSEGDLRYYQEHRCASSFCLVAFPLMTGTLALQMDPHLFIEIMGSYRRFVPTLVTERRPFDNPVVC